ncbi:MAG: DUF6383 domain-containing protein [Bacteroidaceae bacterium]|nr:DUF6383 domain-containing protein [Bacteroidaceae bacterium]
MNKKILIISTLALMLGTSQMTMAQNQAQEAPKAQVEADVAAVEISANNSYARIKNAAGKVLEVYNLAGVKVSNIKLDSEDKTVELGNLPKGCYILKVDKTVRKVYIK